MTAKRDLVKSLRDLRPVSSLILLPDNPRHGDIGAISQSLERFGQQKPIVVNSDGVILAGNHTFQAAKALGWEEIWVTESELVGADQPGFALADNRLSDLATYDHDALLRYLEEQPDLEGTGYDLDDMEEVRQDLATGLADENRIKDEFYTPAWIFEQMELRFEIDVASPPGGIPWIPAARYFTKDDDGLTQTWEGLVWCNPPFSGMAQWARKFTDHAHGVMIASIPGNTTWFAELCRRDALIWFHDKGVKFNRPEGPSEMIPWPTMFAAMGDDAEAGLERLANNNAGVLMRRVYRPK